MFFLGPLALGILALDYIVFRTRTWSWIVIALGAMVPWACYRGGITRPSSSWLMVTPILFGLLVHRGLFLLLSPESWSSRETNR
jgi:hypothetical protein